MRPRTVDTTAEFWGRAARGKMKGDYPVHWLESPLVRRYCVNPRISGNPEMEWLEWVQREFLQEEAARGFVLGCGGGTLERKAARLGICRKFHCIDISPQAIEVARALAEREGWKDFRYEACDANRLTLQADSLDIVLSDMALHHVTELEGLLDQLKKALKPGGWLILNEFVGPNRFQWGDLQLALATRLIRSLPFRLRRNRHLTKWKRPLKPWVWRARRWTPEKVANMDPSESVRSSEIPRLVSERFFIQKKIGYGGTLLALALNNIVGNFTESARDVGILKAMASEETRLIGQGILPSDYVLIAAQRKDE